jgi:cardiolipin synthase
VSVGSTNFDERSFRLNDEANLNIDDAVFAAEQVKITSTASTALKLLSVSSRKPKTQCKRRQR